MLHHANRYEKSEHFYTIKDKILTRYGSVVGYDFQKMEGKKCYTCNGSGVWTGYSWYNNREYRDACNRCGGTGWYIMPCWNVLKRITFGRYTFHKPIERVYKKPATGSVIIEGYVQHEASKYSYIARMLIYLLYDLRGYKKHWRFGWGGGWYPYKQWRPKHLFNNLVHLVKFGRKAIPFNRYKARKIQEHARPNEVSLTGDDLPF